MLSVSTLPVVSVSALSVLSVSGFPPDLRLRHGFLPGLRSYSVWLVASWSCLLRPWWAPGPSAPPWGAPVLSALPWWAPGPSAPPWWAPVPSSPPWLPHGPGPPSLPLFRLRSTALLGLFRSVWKLLLGGGLCHKSWP